MKLLLILVVLSSFQVLWCWVSCRASLQRTFIRIKNPRAALLKLHAIEKPQLTTTTSDITSSSSSSCGDKCESQKCEGNKDSTSFLLNLEAPVSLEELADTNLVKIVNLECSDIQCNQLCWKCLGYEYDPAMPQLFKLSNKVFPKWAAKYPVPPDVIGVTRTYSDPAVDRIVRDANMDLMRSVPRDFKGGVKSLKSVGFQLYKLNELTPNKTRRAQLTTWLIFYRERLFGRTIEQLQAEAAERKRLAETDTGKEPGEISPSEMMYERKRLDTLVVEHD